MYTIIVGAGAIGRPLIDIAVASDHEVVVIEHDQGRARAVAEEVDCLVLHADATLKATLQDAGAHEADAVISTTDHDATNIMVCLLAQELEISRLISVVHRPEDIAVFQQIGVNAVENPQRLIAEYLFRAAQNPSVRDYMRIGDRAEIFEIEVDEDAPIAGKTLREADQGGLLPDDALVVAIDRPGSGSAVIPRGETRVEVGDLVVVYSASGSNGQLMGAFDPDQS